MLYSCSEIPKIHWGISEHCQRKKYHTYHTPVPICKFLGFTPTPPLLEKFFPHILLISKGVTVYLWITLLLSKENCTKQEGRQSTVYSFLIIQLILLISHSIWIILLMRTTYFSG